jgi:hypothetical protein
LVLLKTLDTHIVECFSIVKNFPNLGVLVRKFYTTEGNTSSKKQKEAYPVLALCENCVGQYTVISEGERTYDECVKCGADD